MKKLFKILLAIVVILGITMLVIGKKYHFEKSIIINAPAEKVYQHTNSMKAINEWNPWMKLDPNAQQSYTGTSGQVGDFFAWKGNDKAGQGEEKITELVPNKNTGFEIHFIKPFESKATGNITLEPQGNSTKTTWSFDTEMDYPMNLMKIMMDSEMDKSFDEGLSTLKALAEKP